MAGHNSSYFFNGNRVVPDGTRRRFLNLTHALRRGLSNLSPSLRSGSIYGNPQRSNVPMIFGWYKSHRADLLLRP